MVAGVTGVRASVVNHEDLKNIIYLASNSKNNQLTASVLEHPLQQRGDSSSSHHVESNVVRTQQQQRQQQQQQFHNNHHKGGTLLPEKEARLHAKTVNRLSFDAAERLSGSDETLQVLREQRRWVEDPAAYEEIGVPVKGARSLPRAKLRPGDVQVLLEKGLIDYGRREDVRGCTDLFLHLEWKEEEQQEKSHWRYRPIRNCITFNDHTDRHVCCQVHIATKKQIVEAVHDGEWALALDFAAYYDQYSLSEEVRNRFCFKVGDEIHRVTTLPMGIRTAVGVADAMTTRLLDFPKTTKTMSIIDNVIFIGKKEEVLRDAWTFVGRVREIGAQLNEDVSSMESLSLLLRQKLRWGGVVLDFVHKTVELSQKSLEKTAFSWARRATWTNRQFAEHLGLLWWSFGIIEAPVQEFFPLLRFTSEWSRYMMENDAGWEEPAWVRAEARPDLDRWTSLLLANVPRAVPRRDAPHVWVVATDACRYGWGFTALNIITGETRCYGARWFADFAEKHADKLHRSTFTESHAIVAALCRLFGRELLSTRVLVLTDNTVAEASFNRGFNSHSYDVNQCLRELNRRMPQHIFDFVYIEGPRNPADWYSRNPGKVASEEMRGKAAECLRQEYGRWSS